jgi:hypothetical protein
VLDDPEVGGLVEAVEAQHQAEAVGESELLLQRLAQTQLPVGVHSRLGLLGALLGEQMTAVAGGDDADVRRRRLDAAFEGRLQLTVAALACAEGEVVEEQEDLPRNLAQQGQHVGKVRQVALVHLDEAQPAVAIAREQAAHRGALARAALTIEQYVVRGQAAQELLRVAHEAFDGPVDADQVVEVEVLRVAYGHQSAVSAARVPAKGAPAREERGVGRGTDEALEDPLPKGEHAVEALEQGELERARHGRGV